MNSLQDYIKKAIRFDYPTPTSDFIKFIKDQQNIVALHNSDEMNAYNAYFQMGFPGTRATTFTRKAVYLQLQKIIELLTPQYGLYIFDAFRSLETQAYLFNEFLQNLRQKKPKLSEQALQTEVRNFVSHPDEPARFAVPPHNSGGAIDIALFDRSTGEVLDFGNPIDDLTEISKTDFFERDYDASYGIDEEKWMRARENRRLLFHVMIQFGFTNYHTEWWHYDLGDCMWAQIFGFDHIFDSMEPYILDEGEFCRES